MKTLYSLLTEDRRGMCSVIMSDWSDLKLPFAEPPVWCLNRVITTARYRGQGMARKVMAEALADADAEGVTVVLKIVAEGYEADPDDDDLAAWYGRLGFVQWQDENCWVRRPR